MGTWQIWTVVVLIGVAVSAYAQMIMERIYRRRR
jgi:hypothetical protein